MDYRELIQLFEKRRHEIMGVYKGNTPELPLTKKHQMYGAMREIDLFLEVLRHYAKESKASIPKEESTGLARLRKMFEDELIKD